MKTKWIQHLKDPEDVKNFKNQVISARPVLERLEELLKEEERGLGDREVSPKAYDNPNWAYKQAHANGFRQCLAGILKLIDIKEDSYDR